MRYLNCVEMLIYTKKLLKADSRTPVPVAKAGELLTCMNSLKSMLIEEQFNDAYLTATINDVMSALITISGSNIGMTNMTEAMKQELVSGIDKINSIVCTKAFKFYEENDFEPTDSIIPVMNEVVKSAAENGLF